MHDFPTTEPLIGWEAFAKNWMETAAMYAKNADYWCERYNSQTTRLKNNTAFITAFLVAASVAYAVVTIVVRHGR